MSVIKTPEEISFLRESSAILAKGVEVTLAAVKPGVTTDDLNTLFDTTIRSLGAEPSFLGYHGYPKSICTSINEEVVHAIPGSRILREGDIIGVDCGVRFSGYCSDMARTVAVGKISPQAQQLIEVTKNSLELAKKVLFPGNTIGDIGASVQEYVEAHGYSVVRVLVGHGVGKHVHEEPSIPNFGKRGTGIRLEAGMVLAIEPMVNIGKPQVDFDEIDGWTVRTKDHSLSAHFEDTILITPSGPDVLTSL